MSNGHTVKRSEPHTGLINPHFYFLTFGHSGAQDCGIARMSKKNKNGGLDQYGAERFGRLIFATIRKSV